ncbi:MAG: AEC family transporter [Ruminococcus sp.]|nr:AEC family transporter [Ruminococcus sp.]
MANTILNQTVIMLILIIVGIICAKTGIISKNANKDLSAFVLQIVNPVVILMAYQMEYRSDLVKNLLMCFLLSLMAFIIVIPLAYLLIPDKTERDTSVERFSAIYSNCGFMGIPLINALFGTEGVFYLTAFITFFNLFVWTHGIILISGEKSLKQVIKVFYSPTVIAIFLGVIMFFARIRIPSVPAQALEFIADLNTPMAMIVSGVTMADTNVTALIKKLRVYYIVLLKLIVLPLALAVVLTFLPADEKVRMTVLVAASAPPAAMCTLQCIRYNKNSVYASEIFTAGTILSIITLPTVVKLAELLFSLR